MRPMIVGVILLVVVFPLLAQDGRVRVRVVDSDGAPIPRAEVSLSEKGSRPGVTDKDGVAVFSRLGEGHIRISVSAPEFNLKVVDVAVKRAREMTAVVELDSDPLHGLFMYDAGPAPAKPVPSPVPFALGSRVQIHVTDRRKDSIADAEASMMGADGKFERAGRARKKGEVVWSFVPFGRYRIVVRASGFRNRELNIVVRDDNPIELPIVLETN